MRTLIVGMVTLALLNPAAAFAAGKDELWEMISTTEMKGMPMSIPPSTMRMCVPKGRMSDPQQSVAGENPENKCKVTDVKTSGNKTTWKMRCEPPNEMSGSGEMIFKGDSYHQVIRTLSNMGGHKMEMTQVVDGKRVGTCQAKSE